jgi:hypothetical protein
LLGGICFLFQQKIAKQKFLPSRFFDFKFHN